MRLNIFEEVFSNKHGFVRNLSVYVANMLQAFSRVIKTHTRTAAAHQLGFISWG